MQGLAAEYAAAAGDYDRRWADYNAATTTRTLRMLEELLPGYEEGHGFPVLDVGCGTGLLLAQFASGRADGPRVGLDRTPEMLHVARGRLNAGPGPGVPLVVGDAGALPFADGAFAAAVTNSALHHLDDPAAAVRELARVVRPGGAVVWTDWSGESWFVRAVTLWLKLTGRPMGRLLRPAEMAALLRAAGLEDVRTERFRSGRWGLATVGGRKS